MLAKVLLWSGILGACITVPLYFLQMISERQMIGLTLILSWAALWYEGYNAVQIKNQRDRESETR